MCSTITSSLTVKRQRPGKVTIRPVAVEDADSLLLLIRELAAYQGQEGEVRATAAGLRKDLVVRIAPFQAWFAHAENGELIGFALGHPGYSTWRGATTYYLEDLYVREEYESQGVGRKLMEHVRSEAERLGAVRVQWHVLYHNEVATIFYRGLGAEEQSDWMLMHWPTRRK